MDDLTRLAVNTIKFLSIDAVEKANSGHPGLPMGAADYAFVLWSRYLKLRSDAIRTGPIAIASCSRRATARCCSTRCCTSPATTCRSTSCKHFRQWGIEDAGPSRVAPHARRRGHHRPARPGLRQRRRHGARRQDGRGALPRPLQPPRLGHRLRRRHDGGRRVRGGVARRPPAARQPHLHLRRQQDHARRQPRRVDGRGRRQALRGLRLAHAAHRRPRPRADRRARSTRPQHETRAAVPHPRAHAHRQRRAAQARHAQGARRAARRGGDRGHQEGARLAARQAVLRARRGRGAVGARARPSWRSSTASGTRTRRRGSPSTPSEAEIYRAMREKRVPGRPARRARRRPRRPRPTRRAALAGVGAAEGGGAGAVARRRRRRPRRLDEDADQGLAQGAAPATSSGRNLRFGIREHAMGAIANGLAYYGDCSSRSPPRSSPSATTCGRRSAWRRSRACR